MANEELNNSIIKYYSDKGLKVIKIKKLGLIERLRSGRFFISRQVNGIDKFINISDPFWYFGD